MVKKPVLLGCIALALSLTAAATVPDVAKADTPTVARALMSPTVNQTDLDAQAATALALQAEIDTLNAVIDRKNQTIDNGRRWRQNLQRKLYAQNRELEAAVANRPLTLAEQDALWFAGYAAGGGQNPDVFANIILPCESGGTADPHGAHGDRNLGHSWGRAQIHRPSWKNLFESTFGVSYDVGITDPVLNGHMAAIVEREQGLGAWTCWKIRRR